MKEKIYLDSAATSFPKPHPVLKVLAELAAQIPLSPGRSAHSGSLAASRVLFEARESIAGFFTASDSPTDSSRLVFSNNISESLNLAIFGLLKRGDHVICGPLEHNSMMRPLRYLEQQGEISISLLPASCRGEVEPEAVSRMLKSNTRLIAISHISNVCGSTVPLKEIIARKEHALLLLDSAQSAGHIPLYKTGIDLLAFTGHKGLLGPVGIGGLLVGPRLEPGEIRPLILGGTGSNSELEIQPDFPPDRYESGTPNTIGIAALAAGVEWIKEQGISRIAARERMLLKRLLSGIAELPGLKLYGPQSGYLKGERLPDCGALLSIRLDGWTVSGLNLALDREFGIMCRGGLHCAPAAHRCLGSFPDGTLRVSLSWQNTENEIDLFIAALKTLATRHSKP